MNKDYNYIAAVEKAIAEKYGKDTVQDFRSGWEPDKESAYLSQLGERRKKLLKKHKRKKTHTVGDIEIKTKRKPSTSQRSCPVCKTYSFSSRDDLYMNRFKCCQQCYIDYVEFREERWKSGWRPGDEDWKPPLFKRMGRFFKAYFNKLIWRIKTWLQF